MKKTQNDDNVELKKENQILKERIIYLESLLKENQIDYLRNESINKKQGIKVENITQQHAIEFYRAFKGRKDVYSKRSISKDGKVGYYPQCQNFWKDEICPKRDNRKIKCIDCSHRCWKPLNQRVMMQHLIGSKEDGSDVIGIYPMFEDETTNLLVFDFDNHEIGTGGGNVDNGWVDEVNAIRKICQIHNIDILVEKSRSGKGAHVWMFFEEPIQASIVRNFGRALLTIGAESINLKTFKTYDRMIPTQDHLSNDGLGNLIALPLQGQAVKNKNSVFIDETWNAYQDQWKCIKEVKKISLSFVEEKLKIWGSRATLNINNDYSQKERPWIKDNHFYNTDVEGDVKIYQSNMVYIDKSNLKPRLQNKIRLLGVFHNRNFYKRLKTGLSVRGMNSIVQCSYDIDEYICLPRGCLVTLIEQLDNSSISYQIEDYRERGKRIDVEFNGQLYDNQNIACQSILQEDIGVLNATTAFGKTVVGTYLISQRKVNTLIIVHTSLIMNNWEDDLNKFLNIYEDIPTYTTPTGRIKKRKSIIGKLYSNHNSLNGIIDIAIVNSLISEGKVKELVKGYGMIIVDECHHVASDTLYNVLNEINAKYIYGFTATAKREDGMEQKTFMQLGPIKYKYTTKERIIEQGSNHYIYPRFTKYIDLEQKKHNLNEIYPLLIKDEVRNNQILNDIKDSLKEKRTPLIITKFREHAEYFYNELKNESDKIFLLIGGKGHKTNQMIREELKNVSIKETVILVATAQYVGEGFNFPRLDTLFLTVPISVESNIEQYSGRLHRNFEGKQDVIIYDYVDSHVVVLERMYHKRMRTYKKMGYEICTNIHIHQNDIQMIYDSSNYQDIFGQDVISANSEIIISSPGLNQKKVNYYLKLFDFKLQKGTKITILTLNENSYPNQMIEKTKLLIDLLRSNAIQVITNESLYEHYAIIDKEIVWYGSMNLLSKEKEQDNMIRLLDKKVANEFMVNSFKER